MGSREAASSTDPRTVEAGAGARNAIPTSALKQIRKAQVIVIVEPRTSAQVVRAQLPALEADDNIGREPVHQVGRIRQIPRHPAINKVALAVILLASEQVESKAWS